VALVLSDEEEEPKHATVFHHLFFPRLSSFGDGLRIARLQIDENAAGEFFRIWTGRCKFLTSRVPHAFSRTGVPTASLSQGPSPSLRSEQETFAHLAPDNRFREDDYLVTGSSEDGEFGSGYPVEVSYENMLRGQELFAIFCAICHGETGNGRGVIAQERYGYPTIVSLLQKRIIDLPEGELFNTITYGKNTMGAYGAKIRVEDRWKVVLYMRALQRAATATVDDVPEAKRGDLGL
jgi:hypothetical protein